MIHQATLASMTRLWWPLAATWLMMAVEGPFLAAIIARMGESAPNLAAYGIAYAFGLIAEGPVIMLLSASVRMARGRDDYLRLRIFALLLCVVVTFFLIVLLLPPVFNPLAETLLGLTPAVAGRVHQALLFLLPWPAAIGLRRFWQGVLIAHHQPGRVAVGTIARLFAMAGTALVLWTLDALPGASLGACALSAGVTAEALLTRYLARQAIARSLAATATVSVAGSYRKLASFYLPLAMTPLIGLSIHPVVTFFLGHGVKPLESLAVMPVLYALTFFFRAIGLSFPEVAISVLGDGSQNRVVVRKFALLLAAALGGSLSLIAFTPLNQLWFFGVSGLPLELAQMARLPLQILAFFPALTVAVGYQRALLIDAGVTLPVTLGTVVEASGIFSLLTVLVLYSSLPGLTAAAFAYLGGRLLAIAYLAGPCRKVILSQPQPQSQPLS